MASPPTSLRWLTVCAALTLTPSLASAQIASASKAPYVNFESGPVRQMMVSPDNTRLFVLNKEAWMAWKPWLVGT